jgi:hypothetical protein
MTTDAPGNAIMTTGMEQAQASPPVDDVLAPPVEVYAPVEVEPIATAAPAWRPPLGTRRRRLWTAALAGALLASVGGIGLLYVDDTNNQATIRDLNTRNESLTGRNQNLADQLKVTQGQLTVSRQQVTDLSSELQHPTLGVWNVPMTLHNSSEYLSSTVPDTFTYHLKLTSNGPMDVSILSTQQFSAAIICVNNGVGNTDYCMHHNGAAWGVLGVKSVNYDFTLSEGCAAYLAIITAPSAVTVTPDVTVTYNPASSATGACR